MANHLTFVTLDVLFLKLGGNATLQELNGKQSIMLYFTFQWPLISIKDKRKHWPCNHSTELSRAVLWSYAHGGSSRAIHALYQKQAKELPLTVIPLTSLSPAPQMHWEVLHFRNEELTESDIVTSRKSSAMMS